MGSGEKECLCGEVSCTSMHMMCISNADPQEKGHCFFHEKEAEKCKAICDIATKDSGEDNCTKEDFTKNTRAMCNAHDDVPTKKYYRKYCTMSCCQDDCSTISDSEDEAGTGTFKKLIERCKKKTNSKQQRNRHKLSRITDRRIN